MPVDESLPTWVLDGLPLGLGRELGSARCVADDAVITHAIDQLAVRLTLAFAEANPIVVAVMNGGLWLAADLLARLHFPLQLDYAHATRYANGTHGGEVSYLNDVREDVAGRTVLVIDDVFDHGVTLAGLTERIGAAGATSVIPCVLVNKLVPGRALAAPEFTALDLPDRYLFGRGMDYKGYLRNLRDIYAR